MRRDPRPAGRGAPLAPFAFFLLALLGAPVAARAEDMPRFDQPIACTIGKDCFVQNYVDHAAGTAARDFTCGHLTYDGHNGTDIRLPDYAAMDRGVPVLAAAAGTVLRLRDGMDDVNVREIGRAALNGRDAGNSVVIGHGDGWETQYAHLRNGSVKVKIGDHVEAGQEIGLVGLSGDTEFPHVHFGVRHKGQPIDPYTGPEADESCGHAPDPMWTPAAARKLAYAPSGVISAGLTDRRVTLDDALAGGDRLPPPRRDGAVIGFFVSPFGLDRGDIQDIRIIGPDGTVLVKASRPVKEDQAVALVFIGRKADPGAAWPPGHYKGEYELIRQVDGQPKPVAHAEREFVLR